MRINDMQNSPLPAEAAPGGSIAGNDAPAYRHKVEQAAEKFEAMFIAQMFREMRKVTREMSAADSVFKNSVDSDMLDIADSAVADSLARQRSFGIANAILHQLLPQPASHPDAGVVPAQPKE